MKKLPKPNNITIFGLQMQRIQPDKIHTQNILFSALNWGYGHVMRSLVLLRMLQKQGNELYIVGNKEQVDLYKSEKLKAFFIEHEGYPFQFTGNGNFTLDLMKNFSALKKHYKEEHFLVEKLCIEHGIDIVLADQSLGFYSRKVTSILITHQVNLPLNWWQKPAQWIYNIHLDKFHHLWIPDQAPPNNLAGDLSQTNRKNVTYLGFISRFVTPEVCQKKYDVGVLITGPQPYAQQFFNEMCERYANSNQKVYIVYNGTNLKAFKNIDVFQHQATQILSELLCSAELVISRSGYSTLMDFMTLGIKNVELHPTPGQAEQTYLLKRWLNLNKQ